MTEYAGVSVRVGVLGVDATAEIETWLRNPGRARGAVAVGGRRYATRSR